ncbi:hypothetical protein [Streptomyces sp. NPDC058953]|uniref:hypothetical protein n=1 Tax=unclassified Streptomyces TaxID=2593676 RepID=UPI0036BB530B
MSGDAVSADGGGPAARETEVPGETGEGGGGSSGEVVEAEFTVVNEFTAARISKIRTRNGHRVEIRSLRLGYRVRLDPLALESVSWQSPDVFSRFLDQPFGPETDTRSP